MIGGFDSYIEEFLPILLALRDRGFDVIGFEGPGQGGALEDSGLQMTPNWEQPLSAYSVACQFLTPSWSAFP